MFPDYPFTSWLVGNLTMIVVLSRGFLPSPGRQCERLKKKKILNSLLAVWVISTVLGFKSASSCVRQGGPTLKMPGRTSGTGRGGAQYVCGSAWSVHLSGQISTHSHPSHSGKVSHLCGFAGVPWDENSSCRFCRSPRNHKCEWPSFSGATTFSPSLALAPLACRNQVAWALGNGAVGPAAAADPAGRVGSLAHGGDGSPGGAAGQDDSPCCLAVPPHPGLG